MSDKNAQAWRWVLLIALVAVYWRGLSGLALDWDDPVWLEDPIHGLSVGEALRLAVTTTRDGTYPPLLRLLFYSLGPGQPGAPLFAHHALSLGLFVGSAAGVDRLLRRFGVPAGAALATVALWAAHPTRVESVAWATGLKDTASLALLVVMGLLLVGRPTSTAKIAGTACGIAALLVKAAVFPVPLLMAAVLWWQAGTEDRKRVVLTWLPMAISCITLALVGWACWETPPPGPELPFSRVLLGPWIHGAFWMRLLPQAPMAIVPLSDNPVPLAVVGVVLTGGFAALVVRGGVAAGAFGLWLLPQLPFLGGVSMAFVASDRHLLLPSLGVIAALSLRMQGYPAFLPVVLVATLGFGVVSARRVPDWHDARTLWEVDVTRPGDHYARWHKLGIRRGIDGDFRGAEAAFDRALALYPVHRPTLAHRLIASLAADGWTPQDAALAALLQPPPPDDTAWQQAIAALRAKGEGQLADWAQGFVPER